MSSVTNLTMIVHLNAIYRHLANACPQVVGLDASSAESRTDLLIIVLSAVLLLTGLQWLALKPVVKEPVSRSSQCSKDPALQCWHPETPWLYNRWPWTANWSTISTAHCRSQQHRSWNGAGGSGMPAVWSPCR